MGGGRKAGGESREEIAPGTFIRPLIREWLADLPPAPQLNQNGRGLFMILTGVWAGPSNFLPAELGQTQTAGLGGKEDITLSSGEAQCLGLQ